ncbi:MULTISPECIES: hypothetical protein [Methylobacterium]|jgi:hypothetical protein|uniref:Protein of unassigned function n=1 Tax=Methylobacterium oryzae CBMB20 TaxID=693986 RepID=A0A089QH42_9HYPH|nr:MULTISPECIES: hypothetical protein [Methylobacterium]AIQ93899.1 protein of unassigned function [Methylobacterium oryzae CBMB20]AWV14561.1 hypothetical protein A3862_02875 [Methylobacterium sp. XJLW]KOX58883.1 hypothetical protein ADL19_06245 [Streptomyces purpurogeneiscleroticus]WFS07561.1 hypothetical protein P9K36_30110 [Methylobacterium sp. 391_Methyba4]
MRFVVPALLAVLVSGTACAQPFVPTERAAIDLVRDRRTAGFTTVARTLAYAERVTGGAFRFGGYRVDYRPDVPFARVRICYRLGIDPPNCGLAYRVAVNPPHVEPADRYNGLARDLEHGPQAFLRALAREADLQRQPDVLRKVQAALEPYNPYDWR